MNNNKIDFIKKRLTITKKNGDVIINQNNNNVSTNILNVNTSNKVVSVNGKMLINNTGSISINATKSLEILNNNGIVLKSNKPINIKNNLGVLYNLPNVKQSLNNQMMTFNNGISKFESIDTIINKDISNCLINSNINKNVSLGDIWIAQGTNKVKSLNTSLLNVDISNNLINIIDNINIKDISNNQIGSITNNNNDLIISSNNGIFLNLHKPLSLGNLSNGIYQLPFDRPKENDTIIFRCNGSSYFSDELFKKNEQLEKDVRKIKELLYNLTNIII